MSITIPNCPKNESSPIAPQVPVEKNFLKEDGVGAAGKLGLENPPDSRKILSTFSKKHDEFLQKTEHGEYSIYHYKKNTDSVPVEIFRYAIEPTEKKEKPIEIEKRIFNVAIMRLVKMTSTEEAIALSQRVSLSSVILVDIFEADVKNPAHLNEENTPKSLERHTICLWKKTKIQFMIIDPTNSTFIKRVKNIVEGNLKIYNSDYECNLIEYKNNKFYDVPQGTNFNGQPKGPNKKRDCIDIALKIGIVLNQGVMLFKTVTEVQYSINLLSNQSAVNPVLGDGNNNTYKKHFQSSQISKRDSMKSSFSMMPLAFKNFFNYDAWSKFIDLDYKRQINILKILELLPNEIATIFATKESTDKKAKQDADKQAKEAADKQAKEAADKKAKAWLQFISLDPEKRSEILKLLDVQQPEIDAIQMAAKENVKELEEVKEAANKKTKEKEAEEENAWLKSITLDSQKQEIILKTLEVDPNVISAILTPKKAKEAGDKKAKEAADKVEERNIWLEFIKSNSKQREDILKNSLTHPNGILGVIAQQKAKETAAKKAKEAEKKETANKKAKEKEIELKFKILEELLEYYDRFDGLKKELPNLEIFPINLNNKSQKNQKK